MNEERARRVHALFAEVLDVEDPERAAFLDANCRSAETRAEIEGLLDAHASMGDFLATSAPERMVPETRTPHAPGTQIAAYRIVRVLGAGGAGTVYEAEQKSPARRVALKVMHAGLRSETAQRRFRDEAEILARLEHPDVAHVYEAGVHQGVPWFAMEYLADARTVADHATGLSITDRLRLFAGVCDAIHHGHQKGIIHRDIKPSNVLVDAAGRPKVIDFGVARVRGLETDRREIVGTIPYMSPEQLDPEEGNVDVRSDVYSLGVLLYELLAGRLPYDVSSTSITDARRVIREEPPLPLVKPLRGDIEATLRKALAKDRELRYASAAALADDVRRHLEHRPVEAMPSSALYAARKFARRQRIAFLSIAAVVLVSVTAALVSGWFALQNARERRIAQEESRRAEFQAYVANLAAADAALRVYDVASAKRRLRLAPPELRNWEYHFLVSRLDCSTRTLRGPAPGSQPTFLGEGGAKVISLLMDMNLGASTIQVWSTATGEELVSHGPLYADLRSPVLSPDGKSIAWGTNAGALTLIDSGLAGPAVELVGHRDEINGIVFSPDSARLASASYDGTARVWDAATGACQQVLEAGGTEFRDVAFDASGTRLAASTAAPDNRILIWDVANDRLLRSLEGHSGSVMDVEFSPDGTRLVSASADGTVRLWDTTTGVELRALTGRRKHASAVAFSDDGTQVLSGYLDGTVGLWDAVTGAELTTFWGHTHLVNAVAFGPDPGTVFSSSYDGTVKSWETTSSVGVLVAHDALIRDVAYSPDQRWLAWACFDDTARVHELGSGQPAARLAGHDDIVMSVCFSPDGDLLATGSHDRTVKLWDVHTAQCVATLPDHEGGPQSISFNPDGKLLATGATEGSVAVWDLDTRSVVHRFLRCGEVMVVAFGADGERLAVASTDGMLRIWEVASGKKLHEIRAHEAAIENGVLASDGTTLATCSRDSQIKLWDLATGECRTAQSTPGHAVTAVSFSPDGTRMASTAAATIRLWDVATLQPVLDLEGHKVMTWAVAFSPDGTQLATGGGWFHGEDCTVRLWDGSGADEPLGWR